MNVKDNLKVSGCTIIHKIVLPDNEFGKPEKKQIQRERMSNSILYV